jgi:hypothetical protein
MGLILWIDANTFATGLLEKVFKDQGFSFYCLENVNDFSYLVEDLRPSVLVLDYKTYENGVHRFNEQYQGSELLKNIPFIIIDGSHEDLGISNIIGHLKRPFDPFELPHQIKKMLTPH